MMKLMIKVMTAVMFLSLSACSVNKATSGPSYKDLSVLEVGNDRYAVLAELGEPVVSEKNDEGVLVDVFSFEQGNHEVFKGIKALGYGVLAVGTLGISELITNPVEGTLGKGSKIQVTVKYDDSNKVTDVGVIKDTRVVGKKIQ